MLKKCFGVICSEDEKDSRLTPEKVEEAFDLLLSSMGKPALSRALTTTSARDFGSYSANLARVNGTCIRKRNSSARLQGRDLKTTLTVLDSWYRAGGATSELHL